VVRPSIKLSSSAIRTSETAQRRPKKDRAFLRRTIRWPASAMTVLKAWTQIAACRTDSGHEGAATRRWGVDDVEMGVEALRLLLLLLLLVL